MAKKSAVRAPRKKISTQTIVITKIIGAGLLFFSCSLFFFQHLEMFYEDLLSFNPFVFVFIIGVICICVYGAILGGNIEEQKLYLADRFDWAFKAVATILVTSMLIRSFFFPPYLNVPVVITVLCILSCLLVLFTPRIIDNNNDEF